MIEIESDGETLLAADELRSFIDRYERVEMEINGLKDGLKEIMAEAKGRGYDTKIIRQIISLRKKAPDEIAEERAVLEMYLEALGMEV